MRTGGLWKRQVGDRIYVSDLLSPYKRQATGDKLPASPYPAWMYPVFTNS